MDLRDATLMVDPDAYLAGLQDQWSRGEAPTEDSAPALMARCGMEPA